MDNFGNYVSKCNRHSENIRHIKALEVLYRLKNKQKHYLIYSETPCISKRNILKILIPSRITFVLQVPTWQSWALVHLFQ